MTPNPINSPTTLWRLTPEDLIRTQASPDPQAFCDESNCLRLSKINRVMNPRVVRKVEKFFNRRWFRRLGQHRHRSRVDNQVVGLLKNEIDRESFDPVSHIHEVVPKLPSRVGRSEVAANRKIGALRSSLAIQAVQFLVVAHKRLR